VALASGSPKPPYLTHIAASDPFVFSVATDAVGAPAFGSLAGRSRVIRGSFAGRSRRSGRQWLPTLAMLRSSCPSAIAETGNDGHFCFAVVFGQ